MLALPTGAQNVQHLAVPQTGGIPGLPVITEIRSSSNNVTVTWDGPAGYYQLFQKGSLSDARWQATSGRTNMARRATIQGLSSNALFRIFGPAPRYAGARACIECHQAIHKKETNTLHAQAFITLKNVNEDRNDACLPCHTVGYKMPTGFTSESATPHLAGVQCENCHGPAANHAANPDDFSLRPRLEIAAAMCGGCHTAAGAHPAYDDWATSEHALVTEDMNPPAKISSCGRCHSSSARLSLINGKPLPAGDANVAIGCVTCHDPHQKTANPAQLRNPLASTNDYYLAPTEAFSVKYKTNVNLCAQCHNDAGASWTDSSAAPHPSPQYNIMLGTVGALKSGLAPNQPGSHALQIGKQCIGCHMETNRMSSPTNTADISHTFVVQRFDSCRACHPLPEELVALATNGIASRIQDIKAALDMWAIQKAPAALRDAYGARAWEYTVPGTLSGGGPGPTSAEQAQIPEKIRKARFNLYLALQDGSYGIHNGPFVVTLLDTARDWVQEELR